MERELQFVVKVNVENKGIKEIHVHKDDEAFELAQNFAQRYRITNNQKQHDLLNLLQTKIHEHRQLKEPESDHELTNIQISPKASEKKKFSNRQKLDPETKKQVEQAFKDIWHEYNPKSGTVKFHKYMQIMAHFKQYNKIPETTLGPFSEEQLEA